MTNRERGGRRGPGAAPKLALPACPICYVPDSLFRQQAVMAGDEYIWYECEACGSALMWVGGGRWAYQKIGRAAGHGARRVELRKPMTAAALWRLLPPAESMPEASPPVAPAPSVPRRAGEPAVADEERQPPAGVERGAEDLRASLLDEAVPSEAAAEATSDSLPFGFVVGALVLLACLVLSIALSIYVALTAGGEATPTTGPTITATPVPATATLAPSPTAGPEPTVTRTPEPTLVPTLTPEPTLAPTVTPEPTPEGRSSRRWLARHGARWSGSVRGC
jgi:hypothetical protein